MAKRRSAETLGDMLRPYIEARTFTAWCISARLRPQTVSRLIDGETTPRRATVMALAKGLGVEESRVRAAIEASRDAANG